MADIHEGGCVCGAVRYRVKNPPFRTGVCHCAFCQHEHRSEESGRGLRMEFCPNLR